MSRPLAARVGRTLPTGALLLATLVVNVELAAVVGYFAFTGARLVTPGYALAGLVWVNAALLVFARFEPPSGRRRLAATAAVGYAGLLAAAGGVVGPTNPATPAGWSLSLLPPGWGPALVYGGDAWSLVLGPARTLGYAALAYLLYGRLAEASIGGLAGILGLFSCLSCSFPVLAGALAAAVGGGGGVAAATTGLGYGPATAVYLVTVALLWAPSWVGNDD